MLAENAINLSGGIEAMETKMTDKDKIEILEKTVTELKILLDHYRAITAQYEKLSKPTFIPYADPYITHYKYPNL